MKILIIIIVIQFFGIKIFVESKEKYPKYLITYRNNTFVVSNKPFLLEGNNKNEHPGKCFITLYKNEWEIGNIYYPSDSCKRMTCLENSKVHVEHCGAVTSNEPCKSYGTGEGHYPYCCLIFKCKDLDNKEFLYNPLTPYEGTLEAD